VTIVVVAHIHQAGDHTVHVDLHMVEEHFVPVALQAETQYAMH